MRTKVVKRKGKWKQFIPVYLMMLPGLLYLFINNYMPMAGLVVAFKQVNFSTGIWKSPWVGLKNFEFLFTTDEAAVITRNTILYNLAFIVIGIVLGIFLAILITEVANKTLKKLYQSAILVPFLMSIVIVSYIVYAFLGAEHGLINNSVLTMLGKEPVSWYTRPQYWPFILVFVHTWKGIGYGCLIYKRNRQVPVRSCEPGWRGYFEANPLCNPSLPEGDGDYTDPSEYRKDFLCGFRFVLSGAYEFRTAV